MSFIMPLKRRVLHQAFLLEVAVRCDWRVSSRLIASLFEVALRFEDGSTRDFHDLFARFAEFEFRILGPCDSVGTVSVSAGDVMLKKSS